MKQLFIVSTYYHALIACVKQLLSEETSDILVTAYIPGYRKFAHNAENSKLFEKVLIADEISEYNAENKMDYIFNYHKKNTAVIERQLDFSLRGYDKICIFHDDTWFARYLKCAKIKYCLIEDSLDSFKYLSKTPFNYMLHKRNLKAWIKNNLRIGYVFGGYDKFTVSVEVNEIKGVEISELAYGKLIEQPREEMFNALSENDTNILREVFYSDIPEFDISNSSLLITEPLYEDGYLSSEYEQLKFYKTNCQKYVKDGILVIKPHPRDQANYHSAFPDTIILEKNMPLEILDIVSHPHFKRILSVRSTCMNALSANEYISINL